jgi:glutathione S-transferase
MASHIALNEIGAKFSAEAVDLKTHTFSGGDYKKINPKGYVPALELDNGDKLTENAVLLQYIADQKPEANLIPKHGTIERYHCLEWLNFLATEVHKAFTPLWNPTSSEDARKYAIEMLHKRFTFINTKLQGTKFLMGDQFTVADCYLFTLFGWAGYHKLDMSKYSAIGQYSERIQARPAVMNTLKQEGLIH